MEPSCVYMSRSWPATCYMSGSEWTGGNRDADNEVVMTMTMRRDTDTRHKDTRDQKSHKPTMRDLSRAIAKGRIPYRRDGEDYVVRVADLSGLRAPADEKPETLCSHESLHVGRSA